MKFRISKWLWYRSGGLTNSMLCRQANKHGRWRYYELLALLLLVHCSGDKSPTTIRTKIQNPNAVLLADGSTCLSPWYTADPADPSKLTLIGCGQIILRGHQAK